MHCSGFCVRMASMLRKFVCIVTGSEDVASAMSLAESRRLGNDRTIVYGEKESLVEKLPDSIFGYTATVIVPFGSYSKEKDVRGIIKAADSVGSDVDVVFHAKKKPYAVITKLDCVEFIDADTEKDSGIDEALAVCGLSIGDSELRRIARSPMSTEIVERLLSYKSAGDAVTAEDVTRSTPDAERHIWDVTNLIFKGGSPADINELFGAIRASGGKPEMVSGYVCKQVRVAAAACTARNKKEALLAMGTSPKAVYPVSKGLPRWDADGCRKALDVAAQLDVFIKSSASSRVDSDAVWAALEVLCVAIANCGGSRGHFKTQRKGVKAKKRGAAKIRRR